MNQSLKTLDRPLIWLVVLNLVPQAFLRPLWTSILAAVYLGYRLGVEYFHFPMPARWVQWIAQIIAVGLIWNQYRSIFGDEPSGALLAILTCLKVYELRTKRDYFVAALLCFLVLMSYLLVEQSLLMTVFSAVDVLLIVGFLFALESGTFSWSDGRKLLRSSVLMAVKALPLLAACFVLFPRFSTGFGTGADNKGKTGISDSLRPGSVAKLVRSEELVFRAAYMDGVMPPRNSRYWRGATLDVSRGIDWDRSKNDDRVANNNSQSRKDIEIYIEPGFERFLFSSEDTVHLFFETDSFRTRNSLVRGRIFELDLPLQSRERYYLQVSSDATPEPLTDREHYLKTRGRPSEKVQKLIADISASSSATTVSNLLNYFATNDFSYSLEPGQSDSIDDFLFQNKVGFCEHYAGTTATLLRLAGIPARVVVGFQGGTPSLLENYISVRAYDAHAWVEFYDDRLKRWRRVDPTAQVAPTRLTMGSETYMTQTQGWMSNSFGGAKLYLKFRALLDEVEGTWLGFLLRFDLNKQKQLLSKFGMDEAVFRALPVFLLMAIVLILAILYFFEAQRRAPMSREDQLYQDLVLLLKRFQIERGMSDGPLKLMEKVYARNRRLGELVTPLMRTLILARYGGKRLSKVEGDVVASQMSELKKLSIKAAQR